LALLLDTAVATKYYSINSVCVICVGDIMLMFWFVRGGIIDPQNKTSVNIRHGIALHFLPLNGYKICRNYPKSDKIKMFNCFFR